MKVSIKFEVTRRVLVDTLFERRRLHDPGGPVPRPSGRRELLHWVRCALRSHGLGLWASVDDLPTFPWEHEEAEKITRELFSDEELVP